MVGILVHGDNHFIVRGPKPGCADARALARHWSLIRIGSDIPSELSAWTIVNREFRENLQWAVAVAGPAERNPAVIQLLGELVDRGVPLTDCG